MATRRVELRTADLTREKVELGLKLLPRRLDELNAFNPDEVQERFGPEAKVIQASIEETLQRIFGADTVEYRRYAGATRLDNGPITMGGGTWGRGAHRPIQSEPDFRGYLREGKGNAIALLTQAAKGLAERLEDFGGEVPEPPSMAAVEYPQERVVFVVHGHDDEVKEGVANFLRKIDFEPVILHEKPNKGRPLITKFLEEGVATTFAVVLLTPDDVGGKDAEHLNPRARQNVVLELGFFIGAFGPDRVAVIVRGDIERPSDFEGVAYISYEKVDWRNQIARELEAVGFPIDWRKANA